MKDSVNQKLPSVVRVMCSGLLPDVGTLNCLSFSGGAAEADVDIVAATIVATAIDSTARVRRVIVHSRVELLSPRRAGAPGSTPLLSWDAVKACLWRRFGHRQSELATTDGICDQGANKSSRR